MILPDGFFPGLTLKLADNPATDTTLASGDDYVTVYIAKINSGVELFSDFLPEILVKFQTASSPARLFEVYYDDELTGDPDPDVVSLPEDYAEPLGVDDAPSITKRYQLTGDDTLGYIFKIPTADFSPRRKIPR